MAAPKTTAETTLRLTRTFPAPRERVFQAWTDPRELTQWFAPTDEYTTKVTALELRVGGHYRIEMQHAKGNVHCVVGTYREVRPPGRLVYTWAWEGKAMGETQVTVEFHDRGGSTEVVVTHELFPTAEDRDKHHQGWTGCLDRLTTVL